jgi:hypothetical protein
LVTVEEASAAAYSRAFAVGYAEAVRQSWRRQILPTRVIVGPPPYVELIKNVTWDPLPGRATQRPVKAGASASSKKPAVPAATVTPAAQDYWVETPNTWVRHHVIPRSHLFSPVKPPDETGVWPDVQTLSPKRWSTLANNEVIADVWTDPAKATRAVKKLGTGRTVFRKEGVPPLPASVVQAANPVLVPPPSTAMLAMSIGQLRYELGEAQHKDLELHQIVSSLKRMPPAS